MFIILKKFQNTISKYQMNYPAASSGVSWELFLNAASGGELNPKRLNPKRLNNKKIANLSSLSITENRLR
jgi:hypothetical protein